MELKFMTEPALNPTLMTCPHCSEEERLGIHSQKDRRFCYNTCKHTFMETRGAPLYGSHYPHWVWVLVVTLLAGGCPVPAIVFAFGIDERTVQSWQLKAGRHAQQVQVERVCQGALDLGQVQGDELYVKTQHGAAWMATAMSVFSRLFIWGEVGIERGTFLISRVVARVHAAARSGTPVLGVTDGFSGWAKAVRRTFRRLPHTGKPGLPRLLMWPQVHLVQVFKHKIGHRLANLERPPWPGHHGGGLVCA